MLKLDKHVENGKIGISITGEVDLFNAAELKNMAIPEGAKEITVECSELEYIDSTGLGALVSILKKAKDRGGYVKITGLKPHIFKLFALTELDTVFDIEVGK